MLVLEFVPRSLQEFSENWLHGKGPLPSRLVMFVFAGFAWTLWVTRNKMAIEKVFPKVPSDVCMLLYLCYTSGSYCSRKATDRECPR